MRRQNLGNKVVKRAIMLAMAFMMGITTFSGVALTAKADETTTTVAETVKALDEAEEDETVIVNDVTIDGIRQEDSKKDVDLKSDDVLADEEDAEAKIKAAAEIYSSVEKAVSEYTVATETSSSQASSAASEAATKMTEETAENLEDAIDDAEAKVKAGIKTEAEAQETIAELTDAKNAAVTEYDAATASLEVASASLEAAKKAYEDAVSKYEACSEELALAEENLETAKEDMEDAQAKADAAQDRIDACDKLMDDVCASLYANVSAATAASYNDVLAMIAADIEANPEDADLYNAIIAQLNKVSADVTDVQTKLAECATTQAELDEYQENVSDNIILYNMPSHPGDFVIAYAENIGLENAESFLKNFDVLGDENTTAEQKVEAVKAICNIIGEYPEESAYQAFIAAYTSEDTESAEYVYTHLWVANMKANMEIVNSVYAALENVIDTLVLCNDTNGDYADIQSAAVQAFVASLNLDSETASTAYSFAYGVNYVIEEGLQVKSATAKASLEKAAKCVSTLEIKCQAEAEIAAAKKALDDATTAYNVVAADAKELKALIDEADQLIVKAVNYDSNKKKGGSSSSSTTTDSSSDSSSSTTTATTTTTAATTTATTTTTRTRTAATTTTVAATEEDTTAEETTEIETEETPLAAENEEEEVVEEPVKIEDEAVAKEAEVNKMNWWWLIIVAIAAACGITLYAKKKKSTATVDTTKKN